MCFGLCLELTDAFYEQTLHVIGQASSTPPQLLHLSHLFPGNLPAHAQDFSIVVIPSGLVTGNLSVRSTQEVGTGAVDGGADTGARVGMGVGGVEQT